MGRWDGGTAGRRDPAAHRHRHTADVTRSVGRPQKPNRIGRLSLSLVRGENVPKKKIIISPKLPYPNLQMSTEVADGPHSRYSQSARRPTDRGRVFFFSNGLAKIILPFCATFVRSVSMDK